YFYAPYSIYGITKLFIVMLTTPYFKYIHFTSQNNRGHLFMHPAFNIGYHSYIRKGYFVEL
ncbi:hypothetical protein RPP30_10830, partial [Staphylococcus saprophyticus]|nr:hypothetical protein [Staphylococcus saprophyticus]